MFFSCYIYSKYKDGIVVKLLVKQLSDSLNIQKSHITVIEIIVVDLTDLSCYIQRVPVDYYKL